MDRPEDIPGAVNGRGTQLLCCKMSLLQLMRKRGPPVEQRLVATKLEWEPLLSDSQSTKS